MKIKIIARLAGLALGALSSLSMAAVTVTPPNLSGGLAGTLPGTASVGPDGTSQYHIDLPVPPGTANVVPQIGLHYVSGAPAVMSGLGWSVTGLSEITRCPSTLAQDNGVTLPVTNSASDQFCLDGQRLILISGTLGGNAEFRTEVESFSRVQSFGSNPDLGPDHWTVQTKAGLTVTYGGSAGNATLVTAPRYNETTTRNFSWSVARSQDAHGNYVSYAYEANDGSGEHFPTQIRYSGNDAAGLVPYDAVNFIYGTRTDAYRGWAAGSLITRSRILQAIETRLQTAADGTGGALVRKWSFNYAASPVSARSLLQSIQDCDGAGHCLNPTTFTWTPRDSSSNVIQTNGGGIWGGPVLTLLAENVGNHTNKPSDQIERGVLPVDVNGDGKADLLYSTGDGNWQLCLNTGASFSCSTLPNLPKFSSDTFAAGDFNGDGKIDIFVPPPQYSTVGQFCLSTGTGFNCSPVTVPAWDSAVTTNHWLALDMDGDGRDDLIVIGRPVIPATPSYLCLSTGTTLAACTDVGNNGLADDMDSVDDGETRTIRLTGDFNGDGRMDVLEWYLDDTGTMDSGGTHYSDITRFQVRYGSPSGFLGGPGASARPAFRPAFPQLNPLADTNGDGYLDFMWGGAGNKYGVGPVGYFTTCHLTGASATDCLTTTLPSVDDPHAAPADFQAYDGSGVDTGMAGSLGVFGVDSAGAPKAIVPWAKGTPFPCTNAAGAVIADFNGDGLPDSACYDSVNKRWTVNFQGGAGSYPDLMQTVSDGNGLATTFAYRGLSDPAVYTQGSLTALPMKDVHANTPVVASLSVDAASSTSPGATLVTNYSYSGLRTHVTRRQSLGFETVTSVDISTGIRTVTRYSQTFPTIGMPLGVTTSTSARTLSSSSQNYTSFSTYAGVLFPYASSSSKQQWDLDGSVLPTLSSQVLSIDAWGNVTSATDTIVDSVNAETFTTSTASQFQNNATAWQIGQLTDTVITKTAPDGSSVAREVAFGYDSFGLLATQTNQPNEAALKFAITYSRDPNFGIITKQTQAWIDPLTSSAMSRDSLRMVYTDPAWRFPSTIYNALNQGVSYTYDMSLGQPLTVTDANALITSYSYDGFGRKTRQSLPDATSTSWAYTTCVDTCGLGQTAKSVTITQHWANIAGADQQATEPTEVFHDALGRDVMSRTWDYAESAIYADKIYDGVGNLVKKSNPQSAADRSSGNFGWTAYYQYDAYRRPGRIDTTSRDGSGFDSTYFTYAGLATTTKDANGHSTTRRLNGLGRIRQVTDALSHTTSYGYDPFGNVVKTTDPLGNVNTIRLDHMGHKVAQTDLDLGNWTYVVDPRGLVRRQTDAKAQVTTISYDLLDRVTERLEADLDSRWSFDTAANGVGRLAESYTWIAATNSKDYRRVYAYDALSRVSAATTTLDWDYTQLHTYDNYGRLSTITHRRSAVGAANTATNPTGTGGGSKFVPIAIDDDLSIVIPVKTNVGTGQFGLPEIQFTLGYNNQGDVSSVMRGATTLWSLNKQDARGRTQLETFGSGLMTATGYNAYTGRLESLQTGPGNGSGGFNATLQSDTYGYDPVGNLLNRSWLPATAAAAMSEVFTYDPLDRLQTAQVSGLDLKNFAYDAIGNITSKANVGTYAYPPANSAQAHLLSGITGTVAGLTNPSFHYDANGNTQSGLNRLYAWSAANLPVSVDQLSDGTAASATLRHEFLYGPERQRTREIVRAMSGTTPGAVQRTIYSAGSIEKEIDAVAGTTKIRTYLPLGLGFTEETFAGTTIAPTSAGTPAERFFHKDNLGSLVIVTDMSQAVLQRMAYDPWGRRRQSNGLEVGWQYLNAQSASNTLNHTGYTDQEQLDDLSLVHLNGRVYDPVTGRMTSPDPTIPDGFDLQSLNRASYVRNAPLTSIDPSGFTDVVPTDLQSVETHALGATSHTYNQQQWENAARIYSVSSRVVSIARYAGAATTTRVVVTDVVLVTPAGRAVVITFGLSFSATSRLYAELGNPGADAMGTLLNAIFNSQNMALIAAMAGPSGKAAAPAAAADAPGSTTQTATTASAVRKDDGATIYFHGTGDPQSVLAGLDAAKATSQTNGGGAIGFYLATTYDHAYAYADEHPRGGVIQFSISGTAQAELIAAGAQNRPVMYGRGSEIGREFYIPPTAFPVFNAAMEAGQIRAFIVPGSH